MVAYKFYLVLEAPPEYFLLLYLDWLMASFLIFLSQHNIRLNDCLLLVYDA